MFKVSEGIREELRVLTEPVAVATRAVERAHAPGVPQVGAGYGIGNSVAVLGCGPIGLLVIAVLRSTGAGTIIATDIVDSRLDMAKNMGADVVINVGETSPEQRLEQVQDLTSGAGADIVIECAGLPGVFAEAIDLVRRGGKVIEVGHYTDSGSVRGASTPDLQQRSRYLRCVGVSTDSIPNRPRLFRAHPSSVERSYYPSPSACSLRGGHPDAW